MNDNARDDELAYAKEVWAACATLGYDSEDARRLKARLDVAGASPTPSEVNDLLALATQVQRDSVEWALNR